MVQDCDRFKWGETFHSCYNVTHADHRVRAERQRRPPPRCRGRPGRRRSPHGCSSARPLVGRIAQSIGPDARRRCAVAQGGGPRVVRRRRRRHRSAKTPGRASAHRRRRRRPLHPDRGRHDGRLRRAGEGGRRAPSPSGLPSRSFSTRRLRTTPPARTSRTSAAVEFEGLAAKMAQPEWAPDFGPAAPHPSAGASVIGARMPLIAYNINLNTDRLEVAKKIAARSVRAAAAFATSRPWASSSTTATLLRSRST